jgi:recombination protein RecT
MSMTDTKQEVAPKRDNPVAIVRDQLGAMQDQFDAALPDHIPVARFVRVVMTAIQNNPELLECDRRSLFNAAMKAAQDGCIADGREGAIVVRFDHKVQSKKSANWQIMIAGIRKKARNSGEIATWDVEEVHENDDFEYESGDNPFIRHKPALSNRGKMIACYSVCTLKSGEKTRCVMGIDDILAIRDQYSDGWRAYKAGRIKSTPWLTSEGEMSKKTVARRHSKTIPMSTDLEALIRRDDEPLPTHQVERIEPPKDRSLKGRLDALAGVEPEKPADPPADPDTGEILDNEQRPSSPIDNGNASVDRQDGAAADASGSVENGAGDPSSGGEPAPGPQRQTSPKRDTDATGVAAADGMRPSKMARDQLGARQSDADPAPDPQQDRPAGNGAANEAPAIGPAAGDVRTSPVVAAPIQWPQTGVGASSLASTPATSTTAADEAHKARVAEINAHGDIHARKGQTALLNYLEGLSERGEADFVSVKTAWRWRELAKAADAAKVRK